MVEPLPPLPGTIVGNPGAPILLSRVAIDGVAAAPARGGEIAKIWTRLALTSDDPVFHYIVENLTGMIQHHAATAGAIIDLEGAKTVLMVIKPDETAELWVDAAAICLNVMAKRTIQAGTPIFAHNIVDVSAMAFPLVSIGKEDKVVCLFREAWRFALHFDFNPRKEFSLEHFQRTLGSLYRNLKFRHIFDAMKRQEVSEQLLRAGWFPFAEIINSEFRELVQSCEAGFDLKQVEDKIVGNFDSARLDRMLERWLAKPAFASREIVLRSAIRSFKADDPVAVIKTVLTEIEGVLNTAYRTTHGRGAKIKTLLRFAVESAEQKAGDPDTLLLPNAFARYLERRTYANFDPTVGGGNAASRNAVGHGEAASHTYTKVAALQALLTLDQFAFSI